MVLYSHTVSCSIMALYLLGFLLGLLSLTVAESWWCDVQERKNTKPYFKIFLFRTKQECMVDGAV